MSANSVPRVVADTGDAVLGNRHGVCPGGAFIQGVDLRASAAGKGCALQSGLMATGGAENYL